MHIDYLGKEELDKLLNEILQGISGKMNWYSFFPQIYGYDYFIPDDHDDLNDHPKACRGDDHAIAQLMAGIPMLHAKIIIMLEKIITINRTQAPIILEDNEHAGNHFAVELALYDIKYVSLYADFLFTCDLKHEDYQTFDIIRIIKKWGLCSPTYYLLITRWFNHGDCVREDFDYLTYNGFSIKKQFQDDSELDKFMQALEVFLSKSGYSENQMSGQCFELFEELTEEYIFPNEMAKAKELKNHYHKVVEKLLRVDVVSVLLEETNINTAVDIFQQYEDDDIAEI